MKSEVVMKVIEIVGGIAESVVREKIKNKSSHDIQPQPPVQGKKISTKMIGGAAIAMGTGIVIGTAATHKSKKK